MTGQHGCQSSLILEVEVAEQFAQPLRHGERGLIELDAGVFYSPATQTGSVAVGFNIALGDVDLPATSDPVYGLRHEMWLSGKTCSFMNCHTALSEFGTLVLEPS